MPAYSRRTGPRAQLFGFAVLALVCYGALPRPASAAPPILHETGSTLLYPLFELWIPGYAAASHGITLEASPTNSAEGIRQAIAGTIQIGSSDAYMTDELAEHNPQIVNIPLAISAQAINYNIPDIAGTALKLDGATLAGIYSGRIQDWDAAPIAALNPGARLPHHRIIPIRRADASGDTFVFTQFLDFSSQKWEDATGYGTSVDWPDVTGEVTASGNAGMVKTLAATPYSVAYIGISFSADIARANLGMATLKNQAGNFVVANAETIAAAASTLDPRTPADERLSLVDAPGEDSYPLINYEYAVVSTRQSDPAIASAIRDFLLWSIAPVGGNAAQYLDKVGFIPLPDFIRALSETQIGRIR